MHSEGGMSSEERSTLRQAIATTAWISLRVLNSPFADEREQAILSYAESNSWSSLSSTSTVRTSWGSSLPCLPRARTMTMP